KSGRSAATRGRNSRLMPSEPAKLVNVPHSWTMNLPESEGPANAGDTERMIRSSARENSRIIHLLFEVQEGVDAEPRANSGNLRPPVTREYFCGRTGHVDVIVRLPPFQGQVAAWQVGEDFAVGAAGEDA